MKAAQTAKVEQEKLRDEMALLKNELASSSRQPDRALPLESEPVKKENEESNLLAGSLHPRSATLRERLGTLATLIIAKLRRRESVLALVGLSVVGGAVWAYSILAVKPEAGAVFKDCDECPEMVNIPAGEFQMGSPEGEGRENEHPQHKVTISEPFVLGKYEVTFAEWDACVAAGSCDHTPDDRSWGRGDRPVMDVSWNDAQQYCGWLSETTGRLYRLPSEAEWEYAARAGSDTAYFWGDQVGKNRANCDGCGSEWDNKKTAPVGSFASNPFGLFDMHGNVLEWVEDTLHVTYEGALADGRTWSSGDGPERVVRGGSWFSFEQDVRAAYRHAIVPVFRGRYLGFRCAGVQE